MPFTYIVVPPAAQAASSGSRSHASACGGYTSQTNDVPTTLVPAARNAVISASASSGRVSACDV